MRKGGIPLSAATWNWGEASFSNSGSVPKNGIVKGLHRRAGEGGQVIGVRVEGDDPFEDLERFARLFERLRIRRDEGGEVGAGRVTHHEEFPGITALFRDQVVHLREGEGDVPDVGRVFALGEQAVVHADEDPALAVEEGGFQTDRGLVTLGPAAAVHVDHDRGFGGCVREVKVQLLERVIAVGEVLFDRAGGDEERKTGDEKEEGAHRGMKPRTPQGVAASTTARMRRPVG